MNYTAQRAGAGASRQGRAGACGWGRSASRAESGKNYCLSRPSCGTSGWTLYMCFHIFHTTGVEFPSHARGFVSS